jgi:hypothetical protein
MEDQVSGFFQRCTIYAFPVHTDISMLIIDTIYNITAENINLCCVTFNVIFLQKDIVHKDAVVTL